VEIAVWLGSSAQQRVRAPSSDSGLVRRLGVGSTQRVVFKSKAAIF
jgi:hypothetical protein